MVKGDGMRLDGQPSGRPRVVVMGGSLGGLTAALLLGDAGCDVHVYERSRRPLMGRGVGIVVHPATIRYLAERSDCDVRELTSPARWVRYLDCSGAVAHESPSRFRFTSYFALYRELLACMEWDRYHLGGEVVGFDQDVDGVTVHLADRPSRRCELLVCADGIDSTARRLLLPDVGRGYTGYVAWRGAVIEAELTPESFECLHGAITYFVMPSSHILAYPIPSIAGETEPGRRYTNWVWYRNVAADDELDEFMTDRDGVRKQVSLAPGTVQDRHVEELCASAEEVLPPPLAEMVQKTVEPFVQVVFDVDVPRMVFGRICLIGDAAFALRPHAAAGTAKAAEDAWTLEEALRQHDFDVVAALRAWEPGQFALGRRLLERTREAGTRSQFENSWRIGDPLPFGLHEAGDSALPDELARKLEPRH
jgi:2,6-dihydroxypyridine 3-monooxygenase